MEKECEAAAARDEALAAEAVARAEAELFAAERDKVYSFLAHTFVYGVLVVCLSCC